MDDFSTRSRAACANPAPFNLGETWNREIGMLKAAIRPDSSTPMTLQIAVIGDNHEHWFVPKPSGLPI
ncbi:hypothetical protein A8B75_00620 [Sphingomonadales bacterium EhC05]|jgi:hypothetical protein|nr:hypothetical protein A8B75_00620 [Sphingomonadales bacterium EhC05]